MSDCVTLASRDSDRGFFYLLKAQFFGGLWIVVLSRIRTYCAFSNEQG